MTNKHDLQIILWPHSSAQSMLQKQVFLAWRSGANDTVGPRFVFSKPTSNCNVPYNCVYLQQPMKLHQLLKSTKIEQRAGIRAQEICMGRDFMHLRGRNDKAGSCIWHYYLPSSIIHLP